MELLIYWVLIPKLSGRPWERSNYQPEGRSATTKAFYKLMAWGGHLDLLNKFGCWLAHTYQIQHLGAQHILWYVQGSSTSNERAEKLQKTWNELEKAQTNFPVSCSASYPQANGNVLYWKILLMHFVHSWRVLGYFLHLGDGEHELEGICMEW